MNPFLLLIHTHGGKDAHKRGKYCQYRSYMKRDPKYVYRLTERAFCLDANVLARSGFFKAGRGPVWNYECGSTKYAYLGGADLMFVDSETERYEHDIIVSNPAFCGIQKIQIRCERHSFIKHRYWMICPKCRRRVTTLFIPQGERNLACRRCYKLYYLSQQKSKGRIGEEKYKEQQELYKVHKTAVMDTKENTEDRRS